MGKNSLTSKTTDIWTFQFVMSLNQFTTFWVFFHWLKLKCSLIAKLILSNRTLLILLSSFLAGFINLTCGLLAKLSLWSLMQRSNCFPHRFLRGLEFRCFLKFICGLYWSSSWQSCSLFCNLMWLYWEEVPQGFFA